MNYFDHCYYINLDKRVDRKNHFLKNVIPFLGLDKKDYTRINAVDTSSEQTTAERASGCSLSHLKTLKLAKQKDYTSVIVLEDDFTPTVSKKTFKKYLKFLYTNYSDFNVCQISYNDDIGKDVIKGVPLDESGIVLFSPSAQTTSGYIIKTSFIYKLLPLIKKSAKNLQLGKKQSSWAIDVVWKELQSMDNKWFLLKRSGKQIEDFSDIEGLNVNYQC